MRYEQKKHKHDEKINYPVRFSRLCFERLLTRDAFRFLRDQLHGLQQGIINADRQQINIENLPIGMYFITLAGETRKFTVK